MVTPNSMNNPKKTEAKDSGTNKPAVSRELLEILACPACDDRPAVDLTPDNKFLQCTQCHRKYPIDNGVPVMLVEEAVTGDESKG